MLDGHAVVAVSYDNTSDTLEILNSHGRTFCDDGYFKLSFSYALNPELAFEFYVVEWKLCDVSALANTPWLNSIFRLQNNIDIMRAILFVNLNL